MQPIAIEMVIDNLGEHPNSVIQVARELFEKDWKDIIDGYALAYYIDGLPRAISVYNKLVGAGASVKIKRWPDGVERPSFIQALQEKNDVIDEIKRLKQRGKNEDVIQLLKNNTSSEVFSMFDLMLAKEYLREGRYHEALTTLQVSANNLFPTQDYNAAALLSFDKGRAEYALGLLADARADFNYASSVAKDARYEDKELGICGLIRDLSRDYFNRVNREYCGSFLTQPYYERKLISFVKQISPDTALEHIRIFQINDYPDIHLPPGHPVVCQLYIGHPFVPDYYMPFDNYEVALVEERIREFCLLVQSLGATEIQIEALNSSETDSLSNRSESFSGRGSYDQLGGSISQNKTNSQRLLQEISKRINIHQEFTPYLPPHLPDGLVWYHSEPTWQKLYTQRMLGQNIHEERIETRKSQVVSATELKEIKGELQAIVISAQGEWTSNMEENFRLQENAILSIKVKFAPLSQLPDQSSCTNQNDKPLTAPEQEYLDEVKATLEDGEIGPRERKSLERTRVRLGISEARADEIEASVALPKLTDEEKEYLEEVKAVLEDGEIGPRERKSLERVRIRLGISEERAKEIEKI